MDGIFLKTGIQRISWPISFVNGGGGGDGHAKKAQQQISSVGNPGNGVVMEASVVTNAPQKNSSSRFSFTSPLKYFWATGGGGGEKMDNETGISLDDDALVVGGGENESEDRDRSWVLKILEVRSLWEEQRKKNGNDDEEINGSRSNCCGCDREEEEEEEEEGCDVDEEEGEEMEFDKDSFSKLLKRVSLADAKFYGRLSYLGNLAYCISKIKPQNLLKYHGLRYVTSSVEKKAQSSQAEKENGSAQVQETEKKSDEKTEIKEKKNENQYQISASTAYNIAASAASYVQSHARSFLYFKTSKDGKNEDSLEGGSEAHENEVQSSEMASFVATTNSVTAVVAAKEETKEAVAKGLNSAHSSPCEWFICDDDQSHTRFFVIQGSESLASWQANLLFEPIQFEGLDVLVHRGIYEAAKGIYEQMLPEIHAHLKSHGDSATLCFTGHSLGGSLSMLINLMLLVRGEVPRSSLMPVIMFGAPSIMCGGDQLLRKLGLPRSHVRAITMHRDIVPRAFSCSYPDHVAELLKAISGNFRNHPCLTSQKRLYSPMGQVLILQPEENFSPHHHLLPSGTGLYLLNSSLSDSVNPEKLLRAAQAMFFNSPHPLEILSDRSAYGSDGTIYRDHDMNSYFKSVLGVIRLELNCLRKTKRERRRREVWWPLLSPQGIHAKINVGQRVGSNNLSESQMQSVLGVLQTGRESMRRLRSFVTAQNVQLLVLFLFPARLLVLGAWAAITLR